MMAPGVCPTTARARKGSSDRTSGNDGAGSRRARRRRRGARRCARREPAADAAGWRRGARGEKAREADEREQAAGRHRDEEESLGGSDAAKKKQPEQDEQQQQQQQQQTASETRPSTGRSRGSSTPSSLTILKGNRRLHGRPHVPPPPPPWRTACSSSGKVTRVRNVDARRGASDGGGAIRETRTDALAYKHGVSMLCPPGAVDVDAIKAGGCDEAIERYSDEEVGFCRRLTSRTTTAGDLEDSRRRLNARMVSGNARGIHEQRSRACRRASARTRTRAIACACTSRACSSNPRVSERRTGTQTPTWYRSTPTGSSPSGCPCARCRKTPRWCLPAGATETLRLHWHTPEGEERNRAVRLTLFFFSHGHRTR